MAESIGEWSPGTLAEFSSADKNVRIENKTELSAFGKMYDIVKTETRNGATFYYARADNDEDVYIKKLAQSKNRPLRGGALPGKAQRLYDATFFARDNDPVWHSYPIAQLEAIAAINGPRFYPPGFREIFSPPPDLSFS